jgi:hypothetical protein
MQHLCRTMSNTLDQSPPSATTRSGCVRRVSIVMVVALLVLGALSWAFFSSLKEGAEWLRDLPSRLTRQEISHSFRQSITEIIGTKGDILEVATMQTDETVTKYDAKTAFNDLVDLGTTVSEIRTPVVYRYHIKLSDNWQVRVQDGQCIVIAPALRPSLPPAIRTEGMEKKSEAGWLRFNAAENLAALERDLTPALERRAGNASHLALVREPARKSVAEFVQAWLVKQSLQEVRSITIRFADESQTTPLPPTLPLH